MVLRKFLILHVFVIAILLVTPNIGRATEIQEHVIEHTYHQTLSYRCLVSIPEAYKQDAERKWPLILFLHGGGMPNADQLKQSIRPLMALPAIVVAPLCPESPDGPRYTKWDWKQLGEVVREMEKKYRVDANQRSVIGFSMGGSGAWELPSYQPKLFAKCVVLAGVCHPWSLRNYPKTQVWVFVGEKDGMRKEQQETVTSAQRFGVDVVETVWKDADHVGIFKNGIAYERMLNWLVSDEDLRVEQVSEK